MVHKFKQLGYNIVIDPDSNAVHVMDDCAFDMLELVSAPMTEAMPEDLIEKLSAYPEENVREAYGELYSLYSEGQLFTEVSEHIMSDEELDDYYGRDVSSEIHGRE